VSNIEVDLSKAWQMLSEGNLIPLPMNPNDDVGDIKNAEVVGKGSELDKVNMVIQQVVNSPEVATLIYNKLLSVVHGELLIGSHFTVNGKRDIDTYKLVAILKQKINLAYPPLEDFLTREDQELEDISDFNIMVDEKIVEIAQQKLPEILEQALNVVRKRNQH
jgi:hypothetical protein